MADDDFNPKDQKRKAKPSPSTETPAVGSAADDPGGGAGEFDAAYGSMGGQFEYRARESEVNRGVSEEPSGKELRQLQIQMLRSFAAMLDDFQKVFHARRTTWGNRVLAETDGNEGEDGKAVRELFEEIDFNDPDAVQRYGHKLNVALLEAFNRMFEEKKVEWSLRTSPATKKGNAVDLKKAATQRIERKTTDEETTGTPASSTADYSVAATQIGLILWSSPELRKGLLPLVATVPGLLSVVDNGWNKESAKKAVIPGAIGIASALATSRFLR